MNNKIIKNSSFSIVFFTFLIIVLYFVGFTFKDYVPGGSPEDFSGFIWKNINSLQDVRIPIEINGRRIDGAAEVILVQPLFKSMNLVMMQAPGLKHISSMISSMMSWYESENYFGIKLVSGPDFNPNDYFDILRNNWKLDGLPQKIAEAQSLCIGPDEIKRT